MSRNALLVVDVQKDFCPGGALGIEGGDRVVPPINRYLAHAVEKGWTVFACRDWHPPVTHHFTQYGGEWPPHCVQHTEGATFHDDLRLPPNAALISKGEDPDRPGYSAFDGRTADGRSFLDLLREARVEHLYVAGLATDYCVRQTTLHALGAGIRVTVLGDAIAGVDLQPGDSARAIVEMRQAGAEIAGAENVLS